VGFWLDIENVEIWEDVKGYEGIYEVSSNGRVKSLDRKSAHGRCGTVKLKSKILKPYSCNGRYPRIPLCKEGRVKMHYVHRLVAEAFIDNPLNKPEVNHIDEVKNNNKAENLEWCTRMENVHHGTAIERAAANRAKNMAFVDQYNSKFQLIKRYKSKAELERQTDYDISRIINCCEGASIVGYGFIWRYAEN
jgi:NUMOD4 motif-containing protein/HNH endonuclease